MVKEISGSQGYDGGAQDAEVYAARYCKERYKNQCDIIVKIVRNDQYEGRFFNLFIFTKYYLIHFIDYRYAKNKYELFYLFYF